MGNKKTNFNVLHPRFRTFNFTPSLPSPLMAQEGGLRMRMGLYSVLGSFSLLLLLIHFSCSRVGYFRKQTYSTIVCSTSCGKISSLWWSISSLSFSSYMLFLAFSSLYLSMIFFLCIKYTFTEAQPSCPCSESIAASWNWLCPVQSSPSLFSQKLPLQYHPSPVPKPCCLCLL